MNEMIETGYESVKRELLSRGFIQDADTFRKDRTETQSVIINGQRIDREYTISQVITYLGDGELADELSSETLAGFKLAILIGDECQGSSDIWVRDFSEFTSLCRLS